jgi:hypothetical protein
MARLESGLEAAVTQRLAASRTDGRDENLAQGIYGGVLLALGSGELEEMFDLDAGSEDCGVKLAG